MIKDVTLRDTHIDWIPQIPISWEISRSKYVFRNKSLKNNPNEPLLSVTQRDGVVVRSESDMNVWNPTDDVSGYKLIEPGDFVISLRSFEGGLELSKVKGIVSPAYTVLETIRKIDDHYFWWLMKSHQFIIELNKHVTGIRQGKNIGWDDFSNIYLTLPPIQEQKLISRYLDKKTSQIDSLIKKIEKKIELLKEQRTSLINHYVTKGLDPNVEMKDSGIEWIGEIPKHWNIEVLKHISSVELSSIDRHEYEDEKRVNICHYPDVYRNEYIDSKSALPSGTCSDNEFEKFSLRRGDILLTKDSESPDDIGIPTFVIEDLDNTVCGYHLAIIRMKSTDFHSEFIYRYIESKNVKDYFYVSSSGITRFGLGKGSIENLKVVAPPEDEQKQIAHKISMVSRTTKQLSERLLARIVLLKEYRQSLISSVVTGKVRVTEEMI